MTSPYPAEFRARLRAILGGRGDRAEIAAVERELTDRHIQAVRQLRAQFDLGPVDLIGFHGHTIAHEPEAGRTWQIGDGAALSRALGVPVIGDFRSADVAAGGQGAPLVPAYHRALSARLDRPLAILNLGGVANVTWLGPGEDDLLAFDTGPGNALLDDWVLRHTGQPYDEGGRLAAGGRVDHAFVARFLARPFFALPVPKSLDRDAFADAMPEHLSPEDGAATLVAMTVAGVAAAAAFAPRPPARWLVAGGGRHNAAIMAGLAAALTAPVEAVDGLGWDGDALEAQAFAYLAVRGLRGLPLSYPGTTGVPAPCTGGTLFRG
jgi:anhydro-N-acetylmuramic acid kinase